MCGGGRGARLFGWQHGAGERCWQRHLRIVYVEMIHRSTTGWRHPQWAGGRPRLMTDDEQFIGTLPLGPKLGQPFTRMAAFANSPAFLAEIVACRSNDLVSGPGNDVTFHRGRKPTTPNATPNLISRSPTRSRSDGPGRSTPGRRRRLGAEDQASRTLHGVRHHACYSVGGRTVGCGPAPQMAEHVGRVENDPPGGPIDGSMILDNLSAHKRVDIRLWAEKNNVELCFTPTYSSWANPIEAHFGPLREFVLNNSNHPNHVVLTRRLHAHLRWRNQNSRSPELLHAQRRERARVRAEKGHRWGRPRRQAA